MTVNDEHGPTANVPVLGAAALCGPVPERHGRGPSPAPRVHGPRLLYSLCPPPVLARLPQPLLRQPQVPGMHPW